MTPRHTCQTVVSALIFSALGQAALAEDFTVNTAETTTNAGIAYGNNDTMTVTSSGSIQVTENEAVSNEVSYFTLTNNGTISAINAVPPTFPPTGPFAGLAIAFLGTNNTIINNNVITSSDFPAINVTGANTTVINNATLSGGTDGDGVYINGANAAVTNTGTITAGYDGVYVLGDGARVENSGTITTGDDGIDTSGDNDVIVNSGTITAARDGIETSGAGVVVTNSGVVVGGSDAFDLNGDNSTLNLLLGSRSEGEFSFDGLNGTLNIGKGMNAAFTTDGGNPTTITAARNAYLQDGNQIFALNLDQNFAALSHAATLGSSTHRTAQGQANSTQSDISTRGADTGSVTPWLQISSTYERRLVGAQSAGYSARSGQITAGLPLSENLGVLLGQNDARFKRRGSFKTLANTRLAAVHGQMELASGDLAWTLAAGQASHTSTRLIQNNVISGGFETATASFRQDFIAPSLSYGTLIQPGVMLDVEVGYGAIQTQAYSETGATNNATFGKRDTQFATLAPVFSWTTIGSNIPFDMSAGLEMRRYWGDPVNVTIGSASGNFADADSKMHVTAFLGGRLEHPLSQGWHLASHGRAGISNDQRVSLSAGFKVSKAF